MDLKRNKMSNIPTAEEFIINKEVKQGFLLSNSTEELKDIINSHIEFAKLHVEAALKEASQNAESYVIGGLTSEVERSSILNAYPLENIK